MGRIGIEDLTDRSEASLAGVCGEAGEQGDRVRAVPIDLVVREREGAEQPAPHCALVINRVALAGAAEVGAGVPCVARR